MARRRRTRLLALLAVALLAALVAACGGDDKAASQDVNALLDQTFADGDRIESGRLDLTVDVDARGDAQVSGPVTVSLSGPFERTGDGTLPKFRFAARFSGAGQDIQAGATSTGDKGYVSFQKQDYALDALLFRQFKAGFEEAQARETRGRGKSLAMLGIDPRKWLRHPRNAGEAKVGDDEAIKITGAVDVPRLLDDVDAALQRVGSLGGRPGRGLPGRLTGAAKRRVQDAVKKLDVEIYTGKDDRILRRLRVALDLEAPKGDDEDFEDARIRFDLAITDVNEDQDIEAPEDPRPFAELASRLGGLGLGGLGRGASPRGGSAGGASPEALERYADCIRGAGSDAAEAQKCAEQLKRP